MEIKFVKKELTAEQREKLNKFRAVKPKNDIIKYTPDVFKEVTDNPQEWPVFDLLPLSSTQEIDGNYTDIDPDTKEIKFSSGKFTLHYFLNGVKGWVDPVGMFGIDFKPEYISNGKLTKDACALFPVDLIRDISNKLIELKTVSEDDKISL